MDRFEKKQMKKIRPLQNTWCDWVINYFPEPRRKSVGGFKDKVVSLFKTSTPKQTVNRRGKKLSKPKQLSKPNKQKKSFYIRREQKDLKIELLDTICNKRRKTKKERN